MHPVGPGCVTPDPPVTEREWPANALRGVWCVAPGRHPTILRGPFVMTRKLTRLQSIIAGGAFAVAGIGGVTATALGADPASAAPTTDAAAVTVTQPTQAVSGPSEQ